MSDFKLSRCRNRHKDVKADEKPSRKNKTGCDPTRSPSIQEIHPEDSHFGIDTKRGTHFLKDGSQTGCKTGRQPDDLCARWFSSCHLVVVNCFSMAEPRVRNERGYEQTPKCSMVKSNWRITAYLGGNASEGRFQVAFAGSEPPSNPMCASGTLLDSGVTAKDWRQ